MSKAEKGPIFLHDSSLSKLGGLVQICHVGFPIYSLVCVQKNEFMIGGGGGPSKTGVQNGWIQIRVITHNVNQSIRNNSFTMELILPLQTTRDAVMAMDVTTCPTTKITRMAIAAGPYCNVGPHSWVVDNEDLASGYVRWIHWWPSNIKPSSSTPQYILALSDHKNQIDCYPLPSSNTKSLWKLGSSEQDYRDVDLLDPPDSHLALLCASEAELYQLGSKPPNTSIKWTLPTNMHGRRILLGKRICFGKVFILANCGGHLSKSLGSLSSSMTNLVSRASIGSSHILIYDIQQLKSSLDVPQKQKKIYHKPVSVASLSPDGLYLALGTNDGSVHVLKWGNNTFSSILTIKELHSLSVTCMVFDIASRFLVTGGPDQTLAIISMEACGKQNSISSRLFNFGYYFILSMIVIALLIIWNSWW